MWRDEAYLLGMLLATGKIRLFLKPLSSPQKDEG
jgi:hypothetical protein